MMIPRLPPTPTIPKLGAQKINWTSPGMSNEVQLYKRNK